MFQSKLTFTLVSILPLIAAQQVATPNNSTTGGAEPTANSTASTSTTTTTTGTPQSFPAPTVTGSSCGTAQQNFNQCVAKVSKDISSCPSTDNTCLCQTYANLAACYNACPDLDGTGQTYKGQSTTYCDAAGIKPNMTSTTNTTNTTATTTTPTTNTSPINSKTNTTSASPSVASNFAAKNSGAGNVQAPILGLGLVALGGMFASIFA